MTQIPDGRQRLAQNLGYAGILPFVLTLAMFWGTQLWQVWSLHAFLFYAAIILSFLGGIHWGLALRDSQNPLSPDTLQRLILSMAPSLLAWPALLLDEEQGLWVLAIGFVLTWWYERLPASRKRVPAWYLQLRTRLTLVVLACHLGMLMRFWIV
ncbi:Protein of unknown function [Allopseudospirillum japonicum]|uniref:DUF3429 domain-containing protein n=1 Tax=Allopseudospirillum japonicum TaxID=64971 RepID=A0A1H6QKG7_9GAMM|nr:DUF3429 domain-containing protein [Allopseudospirillum japonicum]SEI39785.1 Protein of unknown function [Allopseudospirillum japonicum]